MRKVMCSLKLSLKTRLHVMSDVTLLYGVDAHQRKYKEEWRPSKCDATAGC